MDDFHSATIQTAETSIFARWSGSGPPVLLLHGFPETHLMWRDVAADLARDFTVVAADLRGYGSSGCPPTTADHGPYSKRAMARDMIAVMSERGFERFAVIGHDRGGRVAYRMALDHPTRVTRLAVLDIVPTSAAWDRAGHEFALAYWPWSFLAQAAPLPERLLVHGAGDVVDHALAAWGTPATAVPSWVRACYVEALRDADHAHAVCEEYRAAAGLDREHDAADLAGGRRIECPMLVLWSTLGALDQWYAADGGPLGLWRAWALNVEGSSMPGGHFFPEAQPELTADALRRFLAAGLPGA